MTNPYAFPSNALYIMVPLGQGGIELCNSDLVWRYRDFRKEENPCLL